MLLQETKRRTRVNQQQQQHWQWQRGRGKICVEFVGILAWLCYTETEEATILLTTLLSGWLWIYERKKEGTEPLSYAARDSFVHFMEIR